MSKEEEPEDDIWDIVRDDPRYPVQAYSFLYEALQHTQMRIKDRRHLTGQELCLGFKQLAIWQFGMMSPAVMRAWNLHQTEDLGAMVYNLVDRKIWGKKKTDSKDDFDDVFSFDDFDKLDIEFPEKGDGQPEDVPRWPNVKP